MNLTTLEYFISAAELCNFTQTAKRHFVAQTAISQQIAKLERELDVTLFIREKNRLVLTDAGQAFYKDVKKLLIDYDVAVEKAKSVHLEGRKIITVGYSNPKDLVFLTGVMIHYQRDFPEVEFILKEGTSENLLQEIKHGVCDFYLNMNIAYNGISLERLGRYTIHTGDMLVAVPREHKKSNSPYFEAKELAEEKFIVLDHNGAEWGAEEMKEHCRQDGYEIQIAGYATNIPTQLMMVELGKGVAFVRDCTENARKGKIRFVPIRNSSHKYGIDIIWNKEHQHELMENFLRYVRTIPAV